MRKMMLIGMAGLLLMSLAAPVRADRAYVTNAAPVKAGPTGAAMQFDLGWDLSWRNGTNYDACWVFAKFSADGGANWRHTTLAGAGKNPAGSAPGSGTPLEIVVPADRKGAFLQRAKDGSGRTEAKGIQLPWDIKADGVADPTAALLRVFALEMVYVPDGPFWAGGIGEELGRFVEGGPKRRALVRHQSDDTYISPGEIIIHSNLFPKGMSPKAACPFPAGEVAIKPTRKNIMVIEALGEAGSKFFPVDCAGRYRLALKLHAIHWNARVLVEGYAWKPDVQPHDGIPKIEELQKVWDSRPLRFTTPAVVPRGEENLAFPPDDNWLKGVWTEGKLEFPAAGMTTNEEAGWQQTRFARVTISAPCPLENAAARPRGCLRVDDVEVRRLEGASGNLVFNGGFDQGLESWTQSTITGDELVMSQAVKPEPFRVGGEDAIAVANEGGKLWYEIPKGEKNPGNIGDQAGPIPEKFPKGYQAFYMMKMDLITWQYRDYLNTLTPTQAQARVGVFKGFYGTSPNIWTRRVMCETSRGWGFAFLGYNDASWPDLAAYADWAALRPLTELEFEKACRGPLYPVANEYSWGTACGIIPIPCPLPYSTIIPSNAPYVYPDTDREYILPREANVSFMGGAPGPTRPGCYSYEGASRVQQGAGYYGALDLTGNLFKMMVTAGNPQGRAFTALHGDGALTAAGAADVPGWPAPTGTGTNATCPGWGIRGGGFYRPWMKTAGCRVADRNVAAANSAARPNYFCSAGIRVGRTAP